MAGQVMTFPLEGTEAARPAVGALAAHAAGAAAAFSEEL